MFILKKEMKSSKEEIFFMVLTIYQSLSFVNSKKNQIIIDNGYMLDYYDIKFGLLLIKQAIPNANLFAGSIAFLFNIRGPMI